MFRRFFRDCHRVLAEGGIIVQQSESLLHSDTIIKDLHANMREAGFTSPDVALPAAGLSQWLVELHDGGKNTQVGEFCETMPQTKASTPGTTLPQFTRARWYCRRLCRPRLTANSYKLLLLLQKRMPCLAGSKGILFRHTNHQEPDMYKGRSFPIHDGGFLPARKLPTAKSVSKGSELVYAVLLHPHVHVIF